jgi:dihydropteroate synthase
MHWQTSRFQIDLSRPQVMGIVNVTPDSFSDGGQHVHTRAAVQHCEQLLKDGADLLDIGAESTRPGAQPVSQQDELARLLPVLREAVRIGVPVSVDTYKPEVMQAALDLGVDIINDIWALRWQASGSPLRGAQVVASHANCGVCVMHMHRDPQTMQVTPMSGDVVSQVLQFLELHTQYLCRLGVEKSRILVDPGVGFGKTVAQNFALLSRQAELAALGHGLLIGWSRKSSLAGMAPQPPLAAHERLAPSLAAALLAAQRGAAVLRVHDVKETVQVLKVLEAAR